MIQLICCNNENADRYFQYLMTQKIHFAIIFVNENINSFVNKFIGIDIAYYHGEHNRKTDQACVPQHIYNMAFLVHAMSFISHSVIIKYENKLHKFIPEGYKYCFSYHKEFPFFRSWPIYLPIEPVENMVMLINPYEKNYENVIVQLLYLLKVDNLTAVGHEVSIYHYFADALDLSEVILHQYPNYSFNMKESNISLEMLRFHPLIVRMQKSEIINLENLLAASKELILKEISQYLNITDLSNLMDCCAWNYPSKPVDSINPQGFNFMVCFDGLINDAESYQTYFRRFAALCEENGDHVIEIVKIKGKYRIVGERERELEYGEIFALAENIDLYIGTDQMLAQIAGLFDVANFTIIFEEIKRYNPPLCKHAVIKPNVNIQTMPAEKLIELNLNLFNNPPKKKPPQIDVVNYGTYTKIEL